MDIDKIDSLLEIAMIHMNMVKIEDEKNWNNQLLSMQKIREARKMLKGEANDGNHHDA